MAVSIFKSPEGIIFAAIIFADREDSIRAIMDRPVNIGLGFIIDNSAINTVYLIANDEHVHEMEKFLFEIEEDGGLVVQHEKVAQKLFDARIVR